MARKRPAALPGERSTGAVPVLAAVALLLAIVPTVAIQLSAATGHPIGVPSRAVGLGNPLVRLPTGHESLGSDGAPLPAGGATTGPTLTVTLAGHPVHGFAPVATAFSAVASVAPRQDATYWFNWTFGDGSTNSTSVVAGKVANVTVNVTHEYATAGSFNLALNVTVNVSHLSHTSRLTIVAYAPFIVSAHALYPQIDLGKRETLFANITGGAPPYNLPVWSAVPAGCVQVRANLSCLSQVGNYSPNVLVKDSAGDSVNATVPFTVNPALAVTAAVRPTVTCSGSTPVYQVNYSASPTGGTKPFSFSWSFGDGTSENTSLNGSHGYALNGTYEVQFVLLDASASTVAYTTNLTTSFPSCGQVSAPAFGPTTRVVVALAIALVVLIGVLAFLLLRSYRRPRPPMVAYQPPPGGASAPPAVTPTTPPASPPGPP